MWHGWPRVRIEQGRSGGLRGSGYRVVAFVLVIGGHLGLGALLLRPASVWRDAATDDANAAAVLELRFIHEPRPSSRRPSLQAQHPAARAEPIRSAHWAKSPALPPVPRAGESDQPDKGRQVRTRVIRMPDLRTMGGVSGGDGGFLERLHAAQRADVVHGVPGSDRTYAPGIRLIDPMDQGIGAVMRTTQRAFGITSRHCIDVDVWKHLTPGQLAARHISPADVASAEAKYRCDSPLGLHF